MHHTGSLLHASFATPRVRERTVDRRRAKDTGTVKQTLYKPLGCLFLALAAAGVVLPILPSTPFVLLAAWFFARSSPRLHDRLLRSELFGPMIHNWEQNRCISLRTKLVALVSMLGVGSVSIVFAITDPTLKIAAACVLTVGAATVTLLRTCPRCSGGS